MVDNKDDILNSIKMKNRNRENTFFLMCCSKATNSESYLLRRDRQVKNDLNESRCKPFYNETPFSLVYSLFFPSKKSNIWCIGNMPSPTCVHRLWCPTLRVCSRAGTVKRYFEPTLVYSPWVLQWWSVLFPVPLRTKWAERHWSQELMGPSILKRIGKEGDVDAERPLAAKISYSLEL